MGHHSSSGVYLTLSITWPQILLRKQTHPARAQVHGHVDCLLINPQYWVSRGRDIDVLLVQGQEP